MMTYILTYLILSILAMILFIFVNEKQLQKNYLKLEEERDGSPSNIWYNFYIFTHILKAPFLFPMIFLLILGNGGKLIK
jgi:hypothetical protein